MSVDVQQLRKGSKVHIDAAVTACFPEEFRSKSDTLCKMEIMRRVTYKVMLLCLGCVMLLLCTFCHILLIILFAINTFSGDSCTKNRRLP